MEVGAQTDAVALQTAACSPIPEISNPQLPVSTARQKPPRKQSLPIRALISPPPSTLPLPAHHGSRKPKEPLSLQQRFEQSILLDDATASTIAAVANECHSAVESGGGGLDQAELERLMDQIPTSMVDFLANYDVNAVPEGLPGGVDWFVGDENVHGSPTVPPTSAEISGGSSKYATPRIQAEEEGPSTAVSTDSGISIGGSADMPPVEQVGEKVLEQAIVRKLPTWVSYCV